MSKVLPYPTVGLDAELYYHGEDELRTLQSSQLPQAQVGSSKLACNGELLSYIPAQTSRSAAALQQVGLRNNK